ncbi:MAG: RusA family crossover junction endodeoxyribonuclease [Gammaproteobacteria bacterium]|nr:RusA family crossover junction endodeoxyribonuclease [Gammaproteobacteria bacterium]
MSLNITLPFPPSLNRYWRHVVIGRSARVLISKEGREYREAVTRHIATLGLGPAMTNRLSVHIKVYPPDRRQRDLDNMLKAALDAIQAAGVFENDGQIDELTVRRRKMLKGGQITVDIYDIEPP